MNTTGESKVARYLKSFTFSETNNLSLLPDAGKTLVESLYLEGRRIAVYINEFWTAKQRQAAYLHELSYRACFKPQLPRFFIDLLTEEGDRVYDPFSGRGTTVIEAGLLGRKVIANDINPLSRILSSPRLTVPSLDALRKRLREIPIDEELADEIDVS